MSPADDRISVMLLAEILMGQICMIMNHTLAFDHMMKAHLVSYPIITEKQALLSCDNALNCSDITGKRAVILW